MMRGNKGDFEVVDSALAYDRYAARYDDILRENLINAYVRRRSLTALLSTFEPGSRLLELGCGTGDEAIELGLQGREVVALDPASAMVDVARRKARESGVDDRVSFRVGDASAVGGDWLDGAQFDGAYASFSLSYEPDLIPVAQTFGRALKEGGTVLLSAMNRCCPTEWFLALMAARPQIAFRRLRGLTFHKVGESLTLVYPRTSWQVIRPFHPVFRAVRLEALLTVLPPHYANRVLKRWPGLYRLLESVDAQISGLPLARHLGDHIMVWLIRAESERGRP